jgi:hypothetical protein
VRHTADESTHRQHQTYWSPSESRCRMLRYAIAGSPSTVWKLLRRFLADTRADELMIHPHLRPGRGAPSAAAQRPGAGTGCELMSRASASAVPVQAARRVSCRT